MDGRVLLDQDMLRDMDRLDGDLRRAIIMSQRSLGYTPEEDRVWVRLANRYLTLSEDVILLNRHPPPLTAMIESKFREPLETDEKLFAEYTGLQRAEILLYYSPPQKAEMVTEWERFKAKAEVLPDSPDCEVGGSSNYTLISAIFAKVDAALSSFYSSDQRILKMKEDD